MKKFNLLFITVLVIATGAFISCDKEDEINFDAELIGTWIWEFVDQDDHPKSTTLIFNSDYSGMLVEEYVNASGETESVSGNFTYSTNGSTLTLIVEGQSIESNYSISGNELTIFGDEDENTDSTVFIKQ